VIVKRLLVSLLLVLLLTTSAASGESPACLSYGPAVVKLTGRIRIKTFPGPPNYESVKKGDAPEEAWVLHLTRPICVKAGKENEFDVAERNVTDVQMALEPEQYKVWRKFARRTGPVVVTGTLFHSHTGHHHTDVLIDVKEIEREH
jgi:hypothetical protein